MTNEEPAPKKYLVTIVAGTPDTMQILPFVIQGKNETDACNKGKAMHALRSNSPVLCYTAHLFNLLLSNPFYCLSEAVLAGTTKAIESHQGVVL
jgi:hypothetical protein